MQMQKDIFFIKKVRKSSSKKIEIHKKILCIFFIFIYEPPIPIQNIRSGRTVRGASKNPRGLYVRGVVKKVHNF